MIGKSNSTSTSFDNGVNVLSSLSTSPINKRLIIANITGNQSLTFASIPSAGKEIHIIVKNTTTSELIVTLPNSGNYVCFVDTALVVPANGYSEINIISDGTKMYIRAL